MSSAVQCGPISRIACQISRRCRVWRLPGSSRGPSSGQRDVISSVLPSGAALFNHLAPAFLDSAQPENCKGEDPGEHERPHDDEPHVREVKAADCVPGLPLKSQL